MGKEMKERMLMVVEEKGHATWRVVSSKISVEDRHLRALNSIKIRPN